MKLFMILAGLLMSAQAYSLTWSEVKANPAQYRIEAPGTFYSAGVYKRFVSLRGEVTTCIAGEQVYAGSVQKCMATSNSDDDDGYSKHNCPAGKLKTFQLYKDIKGTKTVCSNSDDDDNDCSPKTISYEIDTNVKVLIFRKSQLHDDDDAALDRFHPAYIGHVKIQLPQCGG